MKVTTNTSDHLIIENNPIVLAILISSMALLFLGIGLFMLPQSFWIGLVFAAAGLVIGVVFNMVFVRRTQFIFDRTRNLVEMRRKSLRGFTRRSWDLLHLDRAIVETSHSGDQPTHRAALVFDGGMDAGTVPITIVYSNGQGALRAADAVNTWLRG